MRKEARAAYTIREIAERFGVNGATVRNEIRRGHLPTIRFAGRVLIERSALVAYIAARRQRKPTRDAAVARHEASR